VIITLIRGPRAKTFVKAIVFSMLFSIINRLLYVSIACKLYSEALKCPCYAILKVTTLVLESFTTCFHAPKVKKLSNTLKRLVQRFSVSKLSFHDTTRVWYHLNFNDS